MTFGATIGTNKIFGLDNLASGECAAVKMFDYDLTI